MRTIAIVVAAGLWILLPKGATAFQNEPTGFRGIAWGTPLSAVQSQMRPVGATPAGQDQAYVRIGDNMIIGGAALEKILYKFHNGAFSEAFIIAQKGPTNTAAMIAAFRYQFGEATRPRRSADDYVWQGAKSTIFLTCQTGLHPCLAFVHSTAALSQQNAESAAAAARAKKDF
jgi:hypothetical protein